MRIRPVVEARRKAISRLIFPVVVLTIGLGIAVPGIFAQSTQTDESVGEDAGRAEVVGVCGESPEAWHPPVVGGCATGHEHGDEPPAWITAAGYAVSFHGAFNTSAAEHTTRHAAMKGFGARFNGVDVYFRVHAASNPLDRSARFHSYEVWARDGSDGVSHWQGWYDSGDPSDPLQGRVPRRADIPFSAPRPTIWVVDRTSWEQGVKDEQWYTTTAPWSWAWGWTIMSSTTFYRPDENATSNPADWQPTGSVGASRRLEATWPSHQSGGQHRGRFYATQFGEVVDGPDDVRCAGATTVYSVTYRNICLEQFIAPTMTAVGFPGNSAQKEFDASGVTVPN